MNADWRARMATGAVLIVLGLVLFVLQFTEGFGTSVVLFFVGALFITGYLFSKAYGLLIPGGILLGIGLGAIGDQSGSLFSFEGFGAMGLGVGFLSIYVIDRIYRGRTSWWPLIPGGILIATGLASANPAVRQILSVGWPLILVLVGLLVLLGAFSPRRKRTKVGEANLEEREDSLVDDAEREEAA